MRLVCHRVCYDQTLCMLKQIPNKMKLVHASCTEDERYKMKLIILYIVSLNAKHYSYVPT